MILCTLRKRYFAPLKASANSNNSFDAGVVFSDHVKQSFERLIRRCDERRHEYDVQKCADNPLATSRSLLMQLSDRFDTAVKNLISFGKCCMNF